MENWVEEYVNDERTKRLFGEWGENIALEKGFRKGLKQGFNNGIKEKSFEIAKNLLELNISVSDIMKATNLTKEELNKIKNN